jgi:2-polyprenyl-3-methyl-5-hydroxy-6-metoxy-1,4-benzoquinol methylase
MDPNYSAYYRRLHENHWWFQMRARWVLQAIREIRSSLITTSGEAASREGTASAVPTNPKHKGVLTSQVSILDVGCGDALFFDSLAEFGDVEGVETDRDIVNPANPHFQKIHIGPLDDSFQSGKQYSLLLLLDVLEHIPDPAIALRRCVSLLKPGGTLIITVPAFNLVWTNHDVINHHVTRYRKSTLIPLLKQAGLKIEASSYWFQWTFPVKFAERVVEKAFRIQPANPPIPPPLINRALRGLCSLERSILGPLHPPFGTTLFVRCKK